jgi:hypothetical protein
MFDDKLDPYTTEAPANTMTLQEKIAGFGRS